jgi:hypothetical protein
MIPIDEVVHFDITTHHPTTSAATNADSTPSFDVFEEANDTPILAAQSFTSRSITGLYRGTFTASVANGFEAGKWYSVVASATVNAIAAKSVSMVFRVSPAESAAGVPKVDLTHVAGSTTNVSTLATTVELIEGQTDDLGAAGAGLTAVPWNAAWDAEVQSEVTDALAAMFEVARAEPAQGTPAANATALAKLDMVHKFTINEITQDSSTLKVKNNAGTVVDHKATVSDSGTLYTRGKIVSGP